MTCTMSDITAPRHLDFQFDENYRVQNRVKLRDQRNLTKLDKSTSRTEILFNEKKSFTKTTTRMGLKANIELKWLQDCFLC